MSFTGLKQLSYGSVEIKFDEILGIGSFGKVCLAKCGQLPCAAKLLHDSLSAQRNNPGVHLFAERFEQECRFFRMIKHPNIVQYLGTWRDPQSGGRLALLMELMDESLTKFLGRSTSRLPYNTQLNICHDVALALAYLHSNDIVHRDLSSNNVLLIGEGSRAKVTDFGMSKLVQMNPHLTPLTQCPGTAPYMPPEARMEPPRYSNKLDCFSYGVLLIQIATMKFPSPANAHPHQYVEAPNRTGRYLYQLPEYNRRKSHIDLIDPKNPLLLVALDCIKDQDHHRPTSDELCARLAMLKVQPQYLHCTRQSREQVISVQDLTRTIQKLQEDIEREKATKDQYRKEVMELRIFNTYLFNECHAKSKENEQYEKEVSKKIESVEQKLQEQHKKKKKIKQDLRMCWERKEHYKKNLELIKSMICPIYDDVREELQNSDSSSDESEKSPEQDFKPSEVSVKREAKQLCGTVGCSFKGYSSLNDLCPDCYRDVYDPTFQSSSDYPLV